MGFSRSWSALLGGTLGFLVAAGCGARSDLGDITSDGAGGVAADAGAADAAPSCTSSGEWVIETVFEGKTYVDGFGKEYACVASPQLDIGPDGRIHIVYKRCRDLVYTTRPGPGPGAAWATEDLAVAEPDYEAGGFGLAVGADGGDHVIYVYSYVRPEEGECEGEGEAEGEGTSDCWPPAELRYATRPPGGEWATEVVPMVGGAAGPVLDAAGNVHLGTIGPEHLWRAPEGGWTTEVVEFEYAYVPWETVSLAIGPSGSVHFLLTTRTSGRYLVHLWRDRASPWQFEIVGESVKTWLAPASAGTDADGGLHVAYWDRGNETRYAYRAPDGTWTTEIILGPADNRMIPRLALDAEGGVHIAYGGGETDDDLGLAYRPPGGGAWSFETVVATPNWSPTALRVDGEGGIHLAADAAYSGEVIHVYRCP